MKAIMDVLRIAQAQHRLEALRYGSRDKAFFKQKKTRYSIYEKVFWSDFELKLVRHFENI